jgi:flagellar motor protein MotB
MPDWIDNPSSAYWPATHLTAIGFADGRQTAADRALSNIAKIFEVSVQESTLDFSSAEISIVQDERTIANEQTVTRNVSTEATQVLEGTKVVEYWTSHVGRVYALAVLAKQPAASRFRQSIIAQDREVRNLINYASTKAENPIVALKALNRARDAQLARERLNKNLMVVAEGRGIGTRYDAAEVNSLIRGSLATLEVAIRAGDDTVQAELEQALASLGVQLVDESNLTIHGHMDMAPVEAKQGWYWLRGSYELQFEDNGVALAKKRWSIKVSATDEAVLEKRARDEINQSLPRYVYQLLSSDD